MQLLVNYTLHEPTVLYRVSPKNIWTSLEKNGSALNSDKLIELGLVDRRNLYLNFDTSFVKIR